MTAMKRKTEMFTITLTFNGRSIPFDVKGESTALPEHTNRELIKVVIEIVAKDEQSHSIIQQLIDEGKRNGIEGVYNKDIVKRRWKILNNSLKSDPLEPILIIQFN